ncbi:MAG TPA: hypothetical protein VHQ46_05380, partial [Desulfobacteria bacterium]|nr:hypothetical protein [Desulfobacteria bacterium]
MVFIPAKPGGLDVQEIFQLTNSTKQTLTGGSLVDPNGKQKTGWFIPLPQGFQNLSVQQGLSKGDYAVVKDGFQVYKPVKPGTAEIGIVYSLSSNAPVTFTKKFPFTTNALLIDVPKNSFTIAGKGLQQMQTLTDQGVDYVRYVYNGAFQLGDQIDITVNPATATAAGANSADNKVAAGYNVPWHPDGHVAFFTSEPLSY